MHVAFLISAAIAMPEGLVIVLLVIVLVSCALVLKVPYGEIIGDRH